METAYDFETLVPKLDLVLSRGLSAGLGRRGEQVCIEAALCEVFGLPHGDDPGCVAPDVRSYKILLNDAPWSSSEARAAGLRALGIAQIGSTNIEGFSVAITLRTIQVLLPTLFRELLSHDAECMKAALACEQSTTLQEARTAAEQAAKAASASSAPKNTESKPKRPDFYLRLSAQLAFECLRELGSPGAVWLAGF